MKILVLTKRQYMGKDLLDDRFGRFWELPLDLARRGHEIQGIALSYRHRQEGSLTPAVDSASGTMNWHAVNLIHRHRPAPDRYLRQAQRIAAQFHPDIIWACSDAFHGIFGAMIARRCGAQCVIDLYDNFESYGATKVPGVLTLLKRALRSAAGVTSVSPQLAAYVRERYRCRAPQMILENAVRLDLFRPLNRTACRAQLGLPIQAKIVGAAGSLDKNRGMETLYLAYKILADEIADLHLAIAGARRRGARVPTGGQIHDFGNLPLETVPVFVNALDVAAICNRDSLFGRFNFPQKAREIFACGTPLVAAGVGTMKIILSGFADCLYVPGDAQSLARALREQLVTPTKIPAPTPSWSDMAEGLEKFFTALGQDRGAMEVSAPAGS